MDFDHPAVLMSSVFIGSIGLGLFLYVRKAPDYRCLTAGLVLSALPMMAHTMLTLWGLSALCGAGLYAMQKWS